MLFAFGPNNLQNSIQFSASKEFGGWVRSVFTRRDRRGMDYIPFRDYEAHGLRAVKHF
jgi:hypothetical protein